MGMNTKTGRKEWSEEEDDLLKQLIQEGKSASEIGKIFGRTKGSIIGRSHRLFGTIENVQRQTVISHRDKPVYIMPQRKPVYGAVESIRSLKPRQCKYPLETEVFQFCCDNRLPGLPYCDKHMKLTHRKAFNQ